MKQTSIQHFIGIDIAKQTLDVAVILSANKENIVQTTVDNTPRGFQRLVRWLSSLGGFTLDDAVFCMEHTGIYGRAIAEYLFQHHGHVWLEMPIAILRSLGVQRGKNDKVDAQRIALYAYKNRDDIHEWQPPRPCITTLRDLLALRNRLVAAQQALVVPIQEFQHTGHRDAARQMKASCKTTIRALAHDIKHVEHQMHDIIINDAALHELFTFKQLACYCGVAPCEYTRTHTFFTFSLNNFLTNK